MITLPEDSLFVFVSGLVHCTVVCEQAVRGNLCAKKVVGLVDFAIRLKLPDGRVSFWKNSNYRRTVINPAHQLFN